MDYWKEAFREQMCAAKPRDAWSLKQDKHLDPNPESGWKKAVQEHAHASFVCSQCYHTWSSHQVVILFHMYWEQSVRRGWVRWRTFRQECHKCSSTQKEKPRFAREDTDSIIKRLILDIREKCYRERVRRSDLSEVMICEGSGPHQSESCEACQMGLHKGHRGRPDGARHDGMPDGTLHHGKPGGAMYYGTLQSPRYSWTPNLESYEGSAVHTSSRRSLIQPSRQFSPPTVSRPCCVCCFVIAMAAVVFVLVAYWNDWFRG
ncbi:receptor-transporting protein 2-like [Eublepharis macularius]|uniref:Receptor-transporting protein 2-like n=1 Tax=Eublepharis macularius TaxID=481883 RepID=A0AA97L0W8_EUBMA|nr:receptor-transporting protein 2-like [Eublepharis macularius]